MVDSFLPPPVGSSTSCKVWNMQDEVSMRWGRGCVSGSDIVGWRSNDGSNLASGAISTREWTGLFSLSL